MKFGLKARSRASKAADAIMPRHRFAHRQLRLECLENRLALAAPEGYFDAISSGFVASGWARDPDVPSQSIRVEFCIDGNCIHSERTDIPRGDVVPGVHGFEWQIPPTYLDGATHTLRIYALDHAGGPRQQLGASPKTFFNSLPEGYIENVNAANFTVNGWAADRDAGAAAIAIHLYVDNHFEGQAYANLARSVPGFPGTNHGYSIAIPTEYLDGDVHSIDVYGLDPAGGASRRLGEFVGTFQNRLPDGALEGVVESDFTVYGWAADPDRPTDAIPVHLHVDNQFALQVYANLPRSGLPYAGNHGFSIPIPTQYLDGTSHSIKVYGIDPFGAVAARQLFSFESTFQNRLPDGALEGVDETDFTVDGWAADPDRPTDAIPVHLHVDNQFALQVYANLPRSGLPYAGNHGFSIPIPTQYLDGASHSIKVFGIDAFGGVATRQLFSFESTFQNRLPDGWVEEIDPSNFTVKGWAADRDAGAAAIAIRLHIDNQFVGQALANLPRSLPDIPGTNHGFSIAIPTQYLDGAVHSIDVYALDPAGGPSQRLSEFVSTFQNRLPEGDLTGLDTSFSLVGWAGDPDVPAHPIDVHFYIDGNFAGSTTADKQWKVLVNTRYDGFSWRVPSQYLTGTRHTIEVYGIDLTGQFSQRIERSSFPPDIEIDSGSIQDGQATPVFIGETEKGGERASHTFAINYTQFAGLPLQLDPPLVSSPNFVAYYANENKSSLVVQLRSNRPGHFAATVTIPSNDPDESPFSFPVEGTVLDELAPLLDGYVTFRESGNINTVQGPVTVTARDVFRLTGVDASFRLEEVLTGSDVGLTTDIDALSVWPRSNGDIALLISTTSDTEVVIDGVLTTVKPSDLLLFDTDGLGNPRWTHYFQASKYGIIDAIGGNIDAVEALSRNRVAVSFVGPVTVPGLGIVRDQDVIELRMTLIDGLARPAPARLFDPSAIGLTGGEEGIEILAARGTEDVLSIGMRGSYSAGELSGTTNELLSVLVTPQARATVLGRAEDASALTPFTIAALSYGRNRFSSNAPFIVPDDSFHEVTEYSVYGDLDGDLTVHVSDIDALTNAISSSSSSDLSRFDLDGNSSIDSADLSYLLETVLGTRSGDVNLDQRVDRQDAAVVGANFGREAAASWDNGDMNGDGHVNLSDAGAVQSGFSSTSPSPAVASIVAVRLEQDGKGSHSDPRRALTAGRTRIANNRAAAVDRALVESQPTLRAIRRLAGVNRTALTLSVMPPADLLGH